MEHNGTLCSGDCITGDTYFRKISLGNKIEKLPSAVQHIYAFVLVLFGWVFSSARHWDMQDSI